MGEWSEGPPHATRTGLFWAYEALDPLDAEVMLIFLRGNDLVLSIEHNVLFEIGHFSHFMPAVFSPPKLPLGVID